METDGSRPALTWRRTHESPQITAITIARPTIVRTMLGPPVAGCEDPGAGALRSSALPSLPGASFDSVNAAAGQANTSRHEPSTAATVAAARESGVSFVIEGRLRGRVVPVIGSRTEVLRRVAAGRGL